MYVALGDPEEQETIRSKKGAHCKLLEKKSDACRDCPFSPYRENPWLEISDRNVPLALEMLEIEAEGQDGRELSILEHFSTDLIRQAREQSRDQRLAKMIANEVGIILSQMLGGGK
jgi:hypothetical protein